MSVRLVRLRHPAPTERVDGPQEESLWFEMVYQLDDRLIAVGPLGDSHQNDSPRQFTRRHIIEVDFETVDVITYATMVTDLPGEVRAIDGETHEKVVERLQ